jgi:hypothetical protein
VVPAARRPQLSGRAAAGRPGPDAGRPGGARLRAGRRRAVFGLRPRGHGGTPDSASDLTVQVRLCPTRTDQEDHK